MKKGQWIIRLCCLALLMNVVFAVQLPQAHAAGEPVPPTLNATAAILVEASTGQVLYANNADTPLPPASMSKMMTEYLVMDAIKSGKISWDSIVAPGPYAVDIIGSGGMIGPNEKYTVRDLFAAMSIYSANDATVALAEFIGQTEENFVRMMNEKAREFGFHEKSEFINATGLSRADLGKYAPPGDLPDTLMTARDAAILALRIVTDHPEVLEFSSTPTKKFREKDKTAMTNWNWMLEGFKDTPSMKPYVYEGLDGLKTGHTDEAGFCFTGTATRNGMRLISVVMNTPSEAQRFLETRKILDYGFQNFELKSVLPGKSTIDTLKTVTVKKGVKTEVPVVTAAPVDFVVPKGTNPTVTLEAAPLADMKSAPIKQGDVLGTVTVKFEQMEQTVDLVAVDDLDKGSWFRLMMRGIKNFFVDIFMSIGNGLKNLF